jgi:hypothetical protein
VFERSGGHAVFKWAAVWVLLGWAAAKAAEQLLAGRPHGKLKAA